MTSSLPPRSTLEIRQQRMRAAAVVLAVAIATMKIDIDLISTLTVTQDPADDTLLPDIALAVLELREHLDALPWPEDEGHS